MSDKINGKSLLSDVIDLVVKYKRFKDTVSDSSYIEKAKPARVEPLGIVSEDLQELDYLPTILQTGLNIVTAYYLQAVALTIPVHSATVKRKLDALNPGKDADTFINSLEDIDLKFSMEDNYNNKFGLPSERSIAVIEKMKTANNSKLITEPANLAVGKIVEITTGFEGMPPIPVVIRLTNGIAPINVVVGILSNETNAASFTERFYAAKAGRIEWVNDFLLAKDLVKEKKQLLLDDKTGTYAEVLKRSRRGKGFAFLHGEASIADATSIYFISEAVEKQVERNHRGSFGKKSIIKKIFDSSKAMIICVVNREWERITFYYRGIPYPTEVSLKVLQSTNKKSGPDITEILQALTMGKVATIR